MSEGKHTPGPWRVDDLDCVEAELAGGAVVEIALVNPWAELVPEVERANARLIAAAPDFFAAAQSLLEAWDARTATVAEQIVTGKSDRDLQKQAMGAIEGLRAALARATGQ